MHNALIENIHVKHSIFVSARIYIYILYIYIYDTPTQAEFGTKIRAHRSSPKIHQKYRKYQQNQLKHRFLGGTIYIYYIIYVLYIMYYIYNKCIYIYIYYIYICILHNYSSKYIQLQNMYIYMI